MDIEGLKDDLVSSDMPMLVGTNGLALKIYGWLLSYCKSQMSEEDLEDLLVGKLSSAEAALEVFETMECPETVAERHDSMHETFTTYLATLNELLEHLWGEPDPQMTLAKIFRSLLKCDQTTLTSQADLDVQVDGDPTLSLSW